MGPPHRRLRERTRVGRETFQPLIPIKTLKSLLFLALGNLALGAEQPPDYTSPEVFSDGSVTFTIYAPGAKSVSVTGLRGQKPLVLAKDVRGLWSARTAPLAPDIYSYAFNVDGLTVLDVKNRNFKRWINTENMVDVTASTKPLWSLQPVPHGLLTRHSYSSAVTGREWSFQVYTPPGYKPDGAPLPVVFVLHGRGDDETEWVNGGRAHLIADNLLAAGRARPSIIVMTNGHPLPLPVGPLPEDYYDKNTALMQPTVLNEILPLVERGYHVSSKAEDRAIVGLSMGGGQSLAIGLGHPEVFQWVGAMSSVAPQDDPVARFPSLANSTKEHPAHKLLWMAIGKDDTRLERNMKFEAALTKHQIPHEWIITEGAHEWFVWRNYLGDFLPLLFK